MEWCANRVKCISYGKNLRNDAGNGPKYYRKGGAVDIEQFSNGHNEEEVSTSAMEIKKTNFNRHVEHSWRMFFDIELNNKMIQSKLNVFENESEDQFLQTQVSKQINKIAELDNKIEFNNELNKKIKAMNETNKKK